MNIRQVCWIGAALLAGAVPARAADIRVMISGALAATYQELVPEFERRTGHKLITTLASSEGGAGDSIPERLKRQEIADVLVMGRASLDKLVADGKAVAGSEVDIVNSGMGLAVRAGLPKPDISTLEAFKKTLLEAKSVAYSASVSGTYLSTEVFPRLGIAEQVLPKSKRVMSERVGAVLVRGEADVGLQQNSELVPFGTQIQYVGSLPEGAQRMTKFTAAVSANSPDRAAAKQLIDFLASGDAHAAIRKFNVEPVSATRDAQALAVAFAPTGTLRAIINLGNPVLATRVSGADTPAGVSVDLARELGQRLGLAVELVVVTSAGKAVETLRAGDGDIGFFAIDPMRSDGIAFSGAYVNIVGAYLVREGSPLKSLADVDKAGVRIAVGGKSAYDLYLTREIKAATLVRVPTSPEVVSSFLAQNLDVAAGVKQQLEADQKRLPGLRLLPGDFMTIHQAMGVPAARRPEVARYLAGFVENVKATGFVADALKRHGIAGAMVAPAVVAR
jgi:polar amino acid transport system substrate-binding protein